MRMASLYILVALISSSRSLWIMSFTVLPTVSSRGFMSGMPSRKRMRSMRLSACFISPMDCILMYFGEAFVAPVFAHFGVKEILVDRGEFFAKGFVELFENRRVTFHGEKDAGNGTDVKR